MKKTFTPFLSMGVLVFFAGLLIPSLSSRKTSLFDQAMEESPVPLMTILNPGDLAVIAYQSDATKRLFIVNLVDVAAGTVINYTDNGWLKSAEFRSGEGIDTYTFNDATSAGTITELPMTNINLSTGGDQIFLYQNDISTPSLVFGLQMNSNWDDMPDNSNESAQPPALVRNNVSLAIFPERDNARYTGPTTGSQSEILANIANLDNWTVTNDAFSDTDFPSGSFTVLVDLTAPTIAELSPADDATDVAANTNFKITFDENIQAATGNIQLHLASDDGVVESFDVTSDITIMDNMVTFSPSAPLLPETAYYLTIDDEALEDLSGNSFGGINSTTTWNFTTRPPYELCAPIISEIHYDNDGADDGEFIEIMVPTGYEVSGLMIDLYRSNGTSYATETVASGAMSQDGDADVYILDISGIQNGPNGLALSENGTLLEFISYEGTVTATEGPANTETSVNIGVSESSSTPIGFSLQRQSDDNWAGPQAETRGAANFNTTIESCDFFPGAITFITDDLICLESELVVAYNFQVGQAPYSLEYNGVTYLLSTASGDLTLPLPDNVQAGTELFLSLTNIQDATSSFTYPDMNLSVTPIDCMEPVLEDPCVCNNDQSANGAQDGSFSETVALTGTTAGQIWTVESLHRQAGGITSEPVKIPPVDAVAITEFMVNPDGNDDLYEFVELFNYGSTTVDLTGYRLIDQADAPGADTLHLPGLSLAPNDYIVIVQPGAKSDFDTEWFGAANASVVEGTGDFTLGNGGDEIILINDLDQVLWAVAYGNNTEGNSIFLDEQDVFAVPMDYTLGIDRFGEDLGIPGFLGYQQSATAPSAGGDNVGTPGSGPYQALTDGDMPVTMGTRLIYDPAMNRYTLSFRHFDDAGYELVIEGPNAIGSPNNRTFTISNVCQYPTVAFDPALSQGLPQNAVPLVFGLADENDLPEDPDQPATFTVDGMMQTQIEPVVVGPGTYQIEGFFKADSTDNQNGTLMMPANPGCETRIQEPLIIRNTTITTDSCTCSDHVMVTLNDNCVFELQLSNVVTSDACTGMGVLVGDTNPDNGPVIDCPGTFEYVVYDGNNQQLCWGTVTAEDKSGPMPVDTILPPNGAITDIDCSLVDNILNQTSSTEPLFTDFFGRVLENNFNYVGKIVFEDGCVDCGCAVTTSFTDRVEYYDCAVQAVDDGRIGRTVGQLTRTWTAEDCNGYKSKATQVFRIYLPDLEDLFDLPNKEFNTCDPDNFTVPGPDVPFFTSAFEGNVTFLSQITCGYSYNVEEGPISSLCNGYQFRRTYTVLDWCTGESIPIDTVLVRVGDFEAPVFDDCALVSGDSLLNGTKFILDAVTMSDVDTLLPVLQNFAGSGVPISQTVIDTIGSICTYPTISTGPMNCTASIDITLEGLRSRFGATIVEDCNDPTLNIEVFSYLPETIGKIPTGDSSWIRGTYEQRNNMLMGLPVGFHAMAITATDDCYQSELGVIFFNVEDGVKPVMKCDDELRVTLVEGDEKLGIDGYALATAADIDEGSWDNCGPVELQARRSFFNDETGQARADWIAKNDPNGDDLLTDEFDDEDGGDDYTPWRDIVEFFCADVTAIGPDDGGVRVELRGTDAKGNQSICWLDVEVENGTNFGVELKGDNQTIACTDIPANVEEINEAYLEALGIEAAITGIGGCQMGTAGLDIDVSGLNQCGIGTIMVSIDAASVTEIETKNAVTISDRTIEIEVVGDYDYWVKFPADTDYFCEDETAAGVDYATNGCDLITVYEDDERFASVADPEACYKIFRTYKVINWCEYDGESQPTIVSRDWDAHNATDCTTNRNADDEPNNPRTDDAGEYNLNPLEPDGDGVPGDEDIYVIVDVDNRHFAPTADYTGDGEYEVIDGEVDIVFYDNNSDPYDNSTADEWGDDDVSFDGPYDWPGASKVNNGRHDEGYWWAVTRGEGACTGSNGTSLANGASAWYDDDADPANPDVDGNDVQDDSDNRYGSYGYWQYTQHIVVYDDSDPEATLTIDEESLCSIDGTDCDANVSFTVSVSDPCSTEFIQVSYSINGSDQGIITADPDGTYTATFEGAPIGEHTLTVTIEDGCGNVATVSEDFAVKDCKALAPICHEDLVVALMPVEGGINRAMAEIWASDLIASDIGDCSGQGTELINGLPKVTKYSINREDSTVSEEQTNLIFDCGDSNDIIFVEVHAWDEAGNHDYCVTKILVQDNNRSCDFDVASGFIAGAVSTAEAAPVEGVEVGLSGNRSMTYLTDNKGEYGFKNLQEGYDYSIIPQKDEDHRNGVSTFDLILIQKHILGESLLDSPYKLIAADVNNSKSVSTLDLIQLRKLILNIDSQFENNTSWRFVDADHRFQNPQNPWQSGFPEVKNINNLDRSDYANFVAVKIGDVNASAMVEARATTGTFTIHTQEQAMMAGSEYKFDFTAEKENISGYQFTLELANVEIVDVIYGAAQAEHFGVFAKEGIITTSFNGEAIGTLFSVVVRAKADVKASEAIQLGSRYTAAEAYSTKGIELDVQLDFAQSAAAETTFALQQNTPNPFDGETVIRFQLPVAQAATITLQDVAGRVVKQIEGDFAKGINEVVISAGELPSTGVYFYTLQAGEQSATKKLILLEAVNR